MGKGVWKTLRSFQKQNLFRAPRCGGWVRGEVEGRAFHHAVIGIKFEVEKFSNYRATAGKFRTFIKVELKGVEKKSNYCIERWTVQYTCTARVWRLSMHHFCVPLVQRVIR
ncbi:hypothetical protein CEXT_354011 [Caerostris extrusa]|uniref:Uncharacterized protein n=1 Tax=Caerostris extrusa TaxID=172846 RepID=A0AAV4PV21_CAEEX|nr:hypothetical protein CEXT_354011 [Caerostris extrusa]